MAIPSIPARSVMLQSALVSVTRQTRTVDQISIVVDVNGLGAAATRNRAWQSLQTEWITFLDDDDVFKPEHVAKLLACAEDTKADLVYPWFDIDYTRRPGWRGVTQGNDFMFVERADGTLQPAGGRPFDSISRGCILERRNFIPITALVRRSWLEKVDGFPLPNSVRWPHASNEDWGCWQSLLRAGAKFAHLPERTWDWRWHTSHTGPS